MALMRRGIGVLLAALAIAACEDTPIDPGEEYPSVTGSWMGTGASGINFFDLSLQLTQEPTGRITGTGRLQHVVPNQPSFNFTVRWGAYGYPDILVALYAGPNLVDVSYGGRFTDPNKIEGLMNGSGFNNVPITLTRR
jgi:hypothetical protein